MCQAYMEIQVLRKKNKLQFEVDVDEEIYPYLIPKITLQPILENAVLHGIDEKEGGRGTIRLSGRIQEDQIILEVQMMVSVWIRRFYQKKTCPNDSWKTLRSVQCEDTALALL